MTPDEQALEVFSDAIATISTAAATAHPHETGGLLLGWWDSGRIVVRYAIEVPDPEATENNWTRNQRSAQAALDQALAHHRHPWLGYVGDWHSHPSTCPASSHDIAAIKRACGQYEQPLVLLVHRTDNIVEAIVTERGELAHTRRLIETTRRTAAP